MEDHRAQAVPPRWPTVVAIVVTVVTTAAVVWMLARGRPVLLLYDRWVVHVYPFALSLGWLARVLLRREPRHWLGRLFAAFAVLIAIHVGAIALSDAQLVAAGIDTLAGQSFVPSELPLAGAIATWVSSWLWLTWTAVGFPLLLLRFPDGRLPGPRWRLVLPVMGLGLAGLVASFGIATWPGSSHPIRLEDAPLATPLTTGLALSGMLLVLGAIVAALASVVVRWRQATGEQRRQIRIVGLATGVLALTVTLLWPWQWLWAIGQLIGGTMVIAAYGVAILRYRLHDLDWAVNRTVVGSLLALVVTGVYLVVVVGIGSLVGRTGDHPLLPLVAVGIVAVLFEPTRRRLRRVADRVLYGRDVDAYDVLAELTTQLRDTAGIDAVARRVTDLLVRGTGAEGAEILRASDGSPIVLASAGDVHGSPIAAELIVHDGDLLGSVSLHARSASDLAPDADALLSQVAGTLGAVIRNAQLTSELERQVEQLRHSRQRLLTAHDEARRLLERDLHDGAQVQLVALRLQLGMAAQRVDALDGADDLRALLERLGGEVDGTIRTLRELSRGLHPPVLETDGIAAALRSGSRGLPVDVEVAADGLGRFERRVEAAVYFCCLEAIRNAATHAAARAIRVTLALDGPTLRFTVEDDGTGFDPGAVRGGQGLANLEDRITGLDGRVRIDAAPGRGTRIVGELPVQPLVSER